MSTGFSFVHFHGARHTGSLGSSEVEVPLSWLANEYEISVSTHRQALAALLFFYGKVLYVDMFWFQKIGRRRSFRRLPVVLPPDEVVTERAIYAPTTGLTVGGEFLLIQRRIAVRAIGFIFPFFPSVAAGLLLLHQEHIPGALTDFIASANIGAAGLASAFVLKLVIAVLKILLPRQD